jgi:ABC-2 type transport system permease protein
MFLAQFKNELIKLFGKKRTYIGFGVFILAQVAMLFAFKRGGHFTRAYEHVLEVNGYSVSQFISALTVSLIMLLPQIGMLIPLYVSLVGGDLVAKESEDGTLRMILSRPISRFRLLLVKWLAGFFFSVLLVLMLGGIALGIARIVFPWGGMFVFFPDQAFSVLSPGEGIARFIFAQVFLSVNASVMLSIAFMFSCWNMKPAAATILAVSCLLVSLALQHMPFFDDYQHWFVTYHFEKWLMVFQKPFPWPLIIQEQIILFTISATLFAVGFVAFQVRDIKS